MDEKKLLLGNQAVARGIYEGGCKIVSSYPGTPSTEITEFAAEYKEVYAEWAPNEKVALETAIGASIGGARAFAGMKHVGLNVAADPLFTVAYTGVNGGLVIAVADDPGMHSSQNEQDSRHYAEAAKLTMLEPSDSEECLEFTKAAFEISEKFDTPVLLRLTTRVAHSQSLVKLSERVELENRPYEKNPQKFVMVPAFARARHVEVEKRQAAISEWANTCDLNKTEYNGSDIGVITSGIAYQYAKEALGDKVSYLKLGVTYPLPANLLKEFCEKHKKVYVVEELDPFIETACKSLNLDVIGKEVFSLLGELSAEIIAKAILGKELESATFPEAVPVRPPVLCPGCPHRGIFYTLAKMKVFVNGDIGCYALGSAAPLNAMDTTVCMGFSVSGLHGYNKARGGKQRAVAVIGDSTFIHSGITGLINIAYNNSNSVVLILDNSITGMTGHQQNPTTGVTLKGDMTTSVDVEALCHAVGIKNVFVTDPYDTENTQKLLEDAFDRDEPTVIICRRPCILLKSAKIKPAMVIDRDKCKSCKACMKIGCPCISMKDGKAHINPTLCVGCGLCASLCKFNAIGGEN